MDYFLADIDFDLDIRYTIYNSIRHCFGDESILVAQRLKEPFFQALFVLMLLNEEAQIEITRRDVALRRQFVSWPYATKALRG